MEKKCLCPAANKVAQMHDKHLWCENLLPLSVKRRGGDVALASLSSLLDI